MKRKAFTILIATRDRREQLNVTLENIRPFFHEAECMVFDDGSVDGTSAMVRTSFPEVQLLTSKKSCGLLASRNRLLAQCRSDYAISLDDDAHFVSNDPLGEIRSFFTSHPKVAVIGFRIFWGKELPSSLITAEQPEKVAGYVGCGHAWRMAAWSVIRPYPEWFMFYGEEEFASLQLFLKDWEVWYLPSVLVQHRVDVAARKSDDDYAWRLRRSLRAGWYLFFLFYPWSYAIRLQTYSMWTIVRKRIRHGDLKALGALLAATGDFLFRLPRILRLRRPLTSGQLRSYRALGATRIYWKPDTVKTLEKIIPPSA